jgi:hypothetical protein
MSSTTLLMCCQKCGEKFRIKTSHGTVHVTCPKCKTQWDWRDFSSSGRVDREKWRNRALDLWHVAARKPRLSYAASAALLLAGFGLGAILAHYEWTLPPDDLPLPAGLTNLPPALPPSASHRTNRETGPLETSPVDALLPANGVDFGAPSPLGTNRPSSK